MEHPGPSAGPSTIPTISRPRTPEGETTLEDIHKQNRFLINMMTILQGDISKYKGQLSTIEEVVLDMSQRLAKFEGGNEHQEEEEETPRIIRTRKEESPDRYGFSLYDGKRYTSKNPATTLFPALGTEQARSRTPAAAASNPLGRPSSPPTIVAPAPTNIGHDLKLKMPDPLKTSKPQEAKKWLMRVLTWAEYSAGKFPDERALVRYLLAQMDEEAGDWAYPYLGELANPRNTTPTIHDLQTFTEEFIRAFSDPDEERAAARKIVELTQDDVDTKSTNEYATKFKTLAAELTWNDAALMAQFSKGLHWKTKEILSQRERQPSTYKPS
ncbi:retrotransposon gag protein, partial [Rhizoctonia solani AG-3 Rhs1AP]